MLFTWLQLHRQVRVSATVERLPEAESDAYFASRPRASQLGAWASAQSTVLADRAELEAQVLAMEARFADHEHVPRPPHWGGFCARVHEWEFWQGRPSRLHDRLRYRRPGPGEPSSTAAGWILERLSP